MYIWDILSSLSSPISRYTHYTITCDTLEVFEIGFSWKGTERIHGIGSHIDTIKVNYSTNVSMPPENTENHTPRGMLRKKLLTWASETLANGTSLSKESIHLNKSEDCLSCEGFIQKINGHWVITTNARNAEYYGAFKLNVSQGNKKIYHDELEYLFKDPTVLYMNCIDVR